MIKSVFFAKEILNGFSFPLKNSIKWNPVIVSNEYRFIRQVSRKSQGSNEKNCVSVDITGHRSNVALVKLNRPKTFNTMSDDLMKELSTILNRIDNNDQIGCTVLTGLARAFAVGADVKSLQQKTLSEILESDFLEYWLTPSKLRKPIIAAVNGLALGGGCELAMMCDIIYAGDKAEFSQPEIVLGTIPGAGGTQRLPRFISKTKAMEMILTGNRISAREAHELGLVSEIYPHDQLINEAIKTAELIASQSKLIVALAKASVNEAFETNLVEGERYEKVLNRTTFGLNDRKEGMTAFLEKRPANFNND